ncbi:MAG: PHP domain-containing protein [Microthrixaceae bacterium]|nr:PHP domain-containing protein [Microthrixaceae bacterium]
MGYNNPPVPWGEIERRLSDRHTSSLRRSGAPRTGRAAAGRDRSRSYAELHCHSAFSFLDGSSMPEDLVEEAARLGLEALALTDHHGLYGVVRFAQAARTAGMPSVFGAEVTIGSTAARQGPPDPDGRHLVILARDPTGYAQLSTLLSKAQMAGEKGRPRLGFADIAGAASGRARGHWAVLTGCRKGTVPSALVGAGRPLPTGSCGPWWRLSASTTPSWSCGITATLSTRAATTPWSTWP